MQISQPATKASLAGRFTLVLITHNRPAYLRRALQYYSRFECPILVLDSSTHAAEGLECSLPMVDYRHLPQLGYSGLEDKLCYGAGEVRTPFMAFAADDDFMLCSGMTQSLEFLEAHEDYGLCHGYTMMYLPIGREVKYYYRDRKVVEDFSDTEADQRLLRYADNFLPPFYAVTRTDLIQQWYQRALGMGFEYMEIGHAFFLLASAKARILPIPYSVRELNYPKSEHETYVHTKLMLNGPVEQAEREQFAAVFADLATGLQALARDVRIETAHQVMAVMGNCLVQQRSLTVKEIFHSRWTQLHPDWHFQPTQYMEMPFYNQAFFDQLEALEVLIHAQPCGRLQRKYLEPVLLAQQETLRVRPGDSAAVVRQRLEEGLAQHPFNVPAIHQLVELLEQDGEHGRAQVYRQWASRLQEAQRLAAPELFEQSVSVRLHTLFHEGVGAPTAQQLEQLQAHGGGPLLRIVLLDLAGDMEQLQLTLDSLLEGHYKRFRVVVLTTAAPPMKTSASDRVHFLQVSEHAWQAPLNALLGATEWDWLMLARVGVQFSPCGLFKVALELLDAPQCRAVYGDELQRLADGTLNSLLRPSFNLDLLLSQPKIMAGHWLIGREAFDQVGGYSSQYPQAVEFELIMRLIEQGGMQGIGHIDTLLLSAEPDAEEHNGDEVAVLRRHLSNRGFTAGSVMQSQARIYHLRYGHVERPLVSILIPTKDQVGMVRRCVESLLEHTRYKNYEVILIDNQSETQEALHWLAGIEAMDDARLRVLRYPHPFNYSAINNVAARQARGEYLVLLNNDTAITEGDWLDELLNHALRPEVGIVGARLLHADGTLQHAGVVLGLRGPAEHPFVDIQPTAPTYMNRSHCDQNYSAVTGACLMISKRLYEQVGGLDEVAFKVSYNDVDLCLKVGAQGYLTVWTPHATLLHEGSVSQHSVDPLSHMQKAQRFFAEQNAMYEKWMSQMANDPAYNRNLSLHGRGFEVCVEATHAERAMPVVMVLADAAQQSLLSACYAGHEQHIATLVRRNPPYPSELKRVAPAVLVLPATAIAVIGLLTLGQYGYCSETLKILDLSSLPGDGEQPLVLSHELQQSLQLVDRVVVSTLAQAQALEGMHGDVRVAPGLLQAKGSASGDKPRNEADLTARLTAWLPV